MHEGITLFKDKFLPASPAPRNFENKLICKTEITMIFLNGGMFLG